MKNQQHIFILPLEKVESRYTAQWYNAIPKQIVNYHLNYLGDDAQPRDPDCAIAQIDTIDSTDAIGDYDSYLNIVNIGGELPKQTATPGAFLNFVSTNIWKSSQAVEWFKLIHMGKVPKKSKVLFTDAWNPVVIQTRYISDLMGLDLDIHAIWHAGCHDDWDFLGQNAKVKTWGMDFEKSLFQAIDKNYFASKFYLNMFATKFGIDKTSNKLQQIGHPNIFLVDVFNQIKKEPINKRPMKFLFPHRLAKEKQLNIFQDLAKVFSDYEFVVAQEQSLSKQQYHQHLAESRFVFSAALQETHGIAMTEAVLAGAIPLVPNRLSYSEMYLNLFKYASEWTENWESYLKFKPLLIQFIMELEHKIEKFPEIVINELEMNQQHLIENYLDAPGLYHNLTQQ
jgi:hypothetical protein